MRILLIVLVLVMGAAAAGALYLNFGESAPPPMVQVPNEHQVIVAVDELSTGALIAPQNLRFAAPPDGVQPDMVYERPHAADPQLQANLDRKALDEVTGAVVRRRFLPGEAIIRGSVVKPGDSGFLAAVLQPGMRAVTVGVTPITGTGGLIYPGDRVDVLLTQSFTAPEMGLHHRSVSETVASDLRVLAIDQTLQAKASPTGEGKLAQTVTLEVDPRTAESISVATKLGDLSLTIRSLQQQDGGAVAVATGSVWADDVSQALKQVTKQQPVAAQAPKARTVTVIRGDKAEVVTIP